MWLLGHQDDNLLKLMFLQVVLFSSNGSHACEEKRLLCIGSGGRLSPKPERPKKNVDVDVNVNVGNDVNVGKRGENGTKMLNGIQFDYSDSKPEENLGVVTFKRSVTCPIVR